MLDIPDESVLINESMHNFKPPVEDLIPDKSLLSIESKLPDTARRGMRGGVPIEQILMSEDSIEDWRHFTPGYVSQSHSQSHHKTTSQKSKDDYLLDSEDDSMNDRAQSQLHNPLLDYLIKPSTG